MPILFLLPIVAFIFLAGAGSSFLPSGLLGGQMPGGNLVTTGTCCSTSDCTPEAGVSVKMAPAYLRDRNGNPNPNSNCATEVDSYTYYRIRQNVRISALPKMDKIHEGEKSKGTCDLNRDIRQIGVLPDGRQVWWVDYSHEGPPPGYDTSDFILIYLLEETEKDEYKYYHFDVYIKEGVPVPDFVKNCKETGALIPVVEGPNTFPRQTIDILDPADPEFTKSDFYSDYLTEYQNYYLKVGKIDSPVSQEAEKIGTYTQTIDSEIRTYNVFYHLGTLNLQRNEETGYYLYNGQSEPPPVNTNYSPSLQLTALKFITTSEWTWITPECKPALYLYPEKETQLSIKLNPAGILTVSDPPYNGGWDNLIAYPSGEIKYQGKAYPYLYYESQIEKVKVPQKGYVVAKKDLDTFFGNLLPRLGLNQKESLEFKDFWLENLNAQPLPYFFVGILPAEEIERIEPINFSQNPATFIRVRLFFEPLSVSVKVEEPSLPSVPSRQGFTAVDWGGILASGSCQDGQLQNQTVR